MAKALMIMDGILRIALVFIAGVGLVALAVVTTLFSRFLGGMLFVVAAFGFYVMVKDEVKEFIDEYENYKEEEKESQQ